MCSTGASAFVCVRILSTSGILGALTGTAAQWESRSLCCATIDGESLQFAEVNSLRVVDYGSRGRHLRVRVRFAHSRVHVRVRVSRGRHLRVRVRLRILLRACAIAS